MILLSIWEGRRPKPHPFWGPGGWFSIDRSARWRARQNSLKFRVVGSLLVHIVAGLDPMDQSDTMVVAVSIDQPHVVVGDQLHVVVGVEIRCLALPAQVEVGTHQALIPVI